MENYEVWKDIKGYPNYQISNMGRVWSKTSQRYLSQSKNNKGYYQVHMIAINGKDKLELVHRLVALMFIDNPKGYPEVNHIDRNKENNYFSNLEWTTRSGNNRNKTNNRAILQYDKEGNLLKRYGSIAEAAEAVGGAISSIYSYFRRNQKLYKGFIWKFEN